MFSIFATSDNWLLKVLGLGDDIPPNASVQFDFVTVSQSWWALGLVLTVGFLLIAVGVFFLYRYENDTCPTIVKWLLASTRALTLLILLLVILGPALIFTTFRTRYPYVVVLRDASQSMNTVDQYPQGSDATKVATATGWPIEQIHQAPPSRVKIVNALLQKDDGNFLHQLQQRNKVRIVDFSDHVEHIETRPAMGDSAPAKTVDDAENGLRPVSRLAPTPLLKADGRASNMYQGLEESLTANPLAAVVMYTDGQRTGSNDLRELARKAKTKGVPFFIVGVGDPQPARNLVVAKIYARQQVWQNEPFEIEAVLKSEGYSQQEVRVELLEQKIGSDGKPGPPRMVKFTSATIPDGGGQVKASFEHTARESGNFTYTIRVETIDGERKDADNQLGSSMVKVLDRAKIRVLLISGAPSWEYRNLQRLLTRDKTTSLSCWLQTLDLDRPQEGDEPINELPETREELFQYDVVMMLDPNPQEFEVAWIELLKEFASEHSGGVFYMAGPKYSGSFLTGNRTGKMKDLLPIRFGDVGTSEVAALLSTNRTAWPLRIVSSNSDHQVMSFYSDRQESLARWESLPGIFWSFPALEPKPTAQVLVEHSDLTLRRVEGSRPLMVAGRYGSGNTMYLGFNGTWRWRRVGRKAEFYDRFWINVVRFLMESRSLEGNRHGVVQTDLDRYEIGSRVTVTARLTDVAYQPLIIDEVEAVLETGDAEPQEFLLKLNDNRPGEYEAVITTRHVGDHTVRVKIPSSDGNEPASIDAVFAVELPGIETNHVWLNKPLLMDLAKESGGRYFDIDQFHEIVSAIPDDTESIEVPGKPRMLWSTWPVLIGLVLLLGFEWAMRKTFKLL